MVLVWRRWIGGALIALLAIGLSAMLSEAAGSEVDDAVAYFNSHAVRRGHSGSLNRLQVLPRGGVTFLRFSNVDKPRADTFVEAPAASLSAARLQIGPSTTVAPGGPVWEGVTLHCKGDAFCWKAYDQDGFLIDEASILVSCNYGSRCGDALGRLLRALGAP